MYIYEEERRPKDVFLLGEKEKMRLRQYVNEVYTAHKKEERDRMMAEQAEINRKAKEQMTADEEAERLEQEALAEAEKADNAERMDKKIS